MRRINEAARIKLCLLSVGLATLLTGHQVVAQEISPSNQWTAESGTWETAGNWVVRGTNENLVPGDDNVAAIFNGGTATVATSVPNIGELALRGGVLEMNLGGALTAGKAVIGTGGTLRWAGGTLSAEELIINGRIDLASSAASDLSFGSQWQVAQGLNVSGSPNSVTIDGSAPALARGLRMKFGSTEVGAVVSVGNEPILSVDRATGNVQILNVAGDTLDIKGYSIASGNGLLSDAWNSLADQGVPGFAEANPVSGARSTEYSLVGSTALTVGGALDLGGAYDAALAPLPNEEDVTFEYILADGTVYDGPVEYTGPLNDLLLKVDTASGAVSIVHESAFIPALEVTGFTISSSSGSLATEAFAGINDSWTVTNPQATALTQVSLEGSEIFNTGSNVALGSVYTGTQDLSFIYSLANSESLFTGTVVYVEDVVESCSPLNELLGDLDGNGMVEFPDFLTLSANFNADVSGRPENQYTLGDIDCNGIVNFPDFLTLSMNFGSSLEGAAAAVPEPGTGLLTMFGMLGMFMLRRRRAAASAVMVVAATAAIVAPQTASAQGLDARFIRIHPDGVNNGIGNVIEAMGIVDGSVNDVVLNEDISGTYEIIDLAGGGGSFDVNNPYLNGINDDSMNNFLTYLTGEVSFDEGEYSIGCGSDDGCMINMPGISFTATYNENGPTTEGDGQILFNPGRGHDWTFGTFSVPAGGITVPFEALFNEGGGGDSFEIAITDFPIDPEFDDVTSGTARNEYAANNMVLFENDALNGLVLSPGPFVNPAVDGDFNSDGVIDSSDATILQDNMFTSGGTSVGDITGNGFVDFDDLAVFAPIYEAANAAPAASVPEPASFGLASLAIVALLGVRRRRNR